MTTPLRQMISALEIAEITVAALPPLRDAHFSIVRGRQCRTLTAIASLTKQRICNSRNFCDRKMLMPPAKIVDFVLALRSELFSEIDEFMHAELV